MFADVMGGAARGRSRLCGERASYPFRQSRAWHLEEDQPGKLIRESHIALACLRKEHSADHHMTAVKYWRPCKKTRESGAWTSTGCAIWRYWGTKLRGFAKQRKNAEHGEHID
jgi:hypothetical protein